MTHADALWSARCRVLTYDLVGAFLTDPDGVTRLCAYAEQVEAPVAQCYRSAAEVLSRG